MRKVESADRRGIRSVFLNLFWVTDPFENLKKAMENAHKQEGTHKIMNFCPQFMDPLKPFHGPPKGVHGPPVKNPASWTCS